jgi:hypothetical protein
MLSSSSVPDNPYPEQLPGLFERGPHSPRVQFSFKAQLFQQALSPLCIPCFFLGKTVEKGP